MSRFLSTAWAAALLAGAAPAQVLSEWVLTGAPGDQAFTAATGNAPHVNGLDLVRGAGINPSVAANSFSGTAWHTLAPDDYFSLGLEIEPGWEVIPAELWIATRSSNTGPGFLGLFHSGDGFTANLFTFVQSGSTTTHSIVDLGSLGPLSGTVELRVLALNGTSAGGGTISSAGAFRFADHASGSTVTPVRLTGLVVPAGTFAAPYCFGDGSGTPCPCGNAGAAGEGCANSSGSGAILQASGTPSVTAADLVLRADRLVPGHPGVYFQGSTRENGGAGLAFGDGLRCTGPAGVYLEVLTADAAGRSGTTVDIVAAGGVGAGQTSHYQVWYRDPSAGPCGSGFNATQGLSVTWIP